jgi:citrate/tricarballylate utilization protein
MTRRLEFTAADTHYLANLCHNCGACLHACQYAPPNPFGVNVPQSLAQVRITTYERFAWPRALGTLYQRNGLTVAWALSLSLALFLIATMVVQGTWWQRIEGGNFYAIFPHGLLVWMFAPVFAWSVFALGVGVRDFWRAVLPMDGPTPAPIHSAASAEAAHDALRLKYLDGGHGLGCNESDDSTTLWRKRFHHATFYGFMLCFAATSVATLYHYAFGWVAPYPLTSLPVVLGTVGGIGLVIGPVGLLWLNLQRHPEHGDAAQKPMDRAFIALLFLCGSTGLALLALRETAALPLSLAIHLATVMAFFLTMPYGKFAHGIYRVAALLKFAIEKRLPNRLRLGSE